MSSQKNTTNKTFAMHTSSWEENRDIYLYILCNCCWFPAWTICWANSCNKGKIRGGISVGVVYMEFSVVLFWWSEWLCDDGILPPESPGDPDGRIELGRHSKSLSGSTGLLKEWNFYSDHMKKCKWIIYWFIISYTMDELRRNNLPNIIINQDKRERGFKEWTLSSH